MPGTRPTQKTYCYRIRNSAIDSPFSQEVTTGCRESWIRRQWTGRQSSLWAHDFTALCSAGSEIAARGDTVRTITACGAERQGEMVFITVTADGYLYNMVRILAGTLLEVGQHRLKPEDIRTFWKAGTAARPAQRCRPRGLFCSGWSTRGRMKPENCLRKVF